MLVFHLTIDRLQKSYISFQVKFALLPPGPETMVLLWEHKLPALRDQDHCHVQERADKTSQNFPTIFKLHFS